jgi:tRNA threonylcarbamoyladenosine biosynthesis protein TsaE
MEFEIRSEIELAAAAARWCEAWRAAGLRRLLAGLRGDLGAGKTTLVRSLLRGLGYGGRVPSPTYTLLEHYHVAGIDLVHMDLYRLTGAAELEPLGLRDWLAEPGIWLFAEWPERAGAWADSLDLDIAIEIRADQSRRLVLTGQTELGRVVVDALT